MSAIFMMFVLLSVLPDGGVPADEATSVPKAQPAKLEAGMQLPLFESLDDEGQPWKLADHLGEKVVVLYFYPGDFTGGCTKQNQAYRDSLAKIEEMGAKVIGVSGDEISTHQLFKRTFGIKHSLLSDAEGKLGKLLGVPINAGGNVRAIDPDRRPLLDTDGNRITINRPLTLARWTIVMGRDGRIASLRNAVNPVTDAEEVQKIVASLAK